MDNQSTPAKMDASKPSFVASIFNRDIPFDEDSFARFTEALKSYRARLIKKSGIEQIKKTSNDEKIVNVEKEAIKAKSPALPPTPPPSADIKSVSPPINESSEKDAIKRKRRVKYTPRRESTDVVNPKQDNSKPKDTEANQNTNSDPHLSKHGSCSEKIVEQERLLPNPGKSSIGNTGEFVCDFRLPGNATNRPYVPDTITRNYHQISGCMEERMNNFPQSYPRFPAPNLSSLPNGSMAQNVPDTRHPSIPINQSRGGETGFQMPNQSVPLNGGTSPVFRISSVVSLPMMQSALTQNSSAAQNAHGSQQLGFPMASAP